MPTLPGQERRRGRWQAYVAGLFESQVAGTSLLNRLHQEA